MSAVFSSSEIYRHDSCLWSVQPAFLYCHIQILAWRDIAQAIYLQLCMLVHVKCMHHHPECAHEVGCPAKH